MQLTDSLDQRSPQRLVVTLLGATSHMIFDQALGALGHLAVVLAYLEPDAAPVGADGVAGLVHCRPRW